MAPEVLDNPEYFSSTSDVWAFGVVLWQIFTYGDVPYASCSVEDVYELQPRLDPPEEAPSEIASVMERCWVRGLRRLV